MRSNPFQRPVKELVEATQKDVIGTYRRESVEKKQARGERIHTTFKDKLTDEQLSEPTRLALLGAMSQMAHIYGGTVDPATIAKRRAKNKAARKARRLNRK